MRTLDLLVVLLAAAAGPHGRLRTHLHYSVAGRGRAGSRGIHGEARVGVEGHEEEAHWAPRESERGRFLRVSRAQERRVSYPERGESEGQGSTVGSERERQRETEAARASGLTSIYWRRFAGRLLGVHLECRLRQPRKLLGLPGAAAWPWWQRRQSRARWLVQLQKRVQRKQLCGGAGPVRVSADCELW